jgi:hypothetical protein
MNRRAFIVDGEAALAPPLAAEAQPTGDRDAHDSYPALSAFLLALMHLAPSAARDKHSAQRARMVAEISVKDRSAISERTSLNVEC